MASILIRLLNSGYTVQMQKVHTTIVVMAYEDGCKEIISRPIHHMVDGAMADVYQQIKEKRPSLFRDFDEEKP